MELLSHAFGKIDEVKVLPVGDIQWAGDKKEVALKMLQRHIQWGVDNDCWFIGMGDYLDTFSPSNRARLYSAGLYDTAVKSMDRDAEDRVRELYDIALVPSKGRWLGLLEGHHYHQYKSGITTDMQLADLLKAPFLGTSAVMRMTFRKDEPKGASGEVRWWLHHGAGSGSTPGSAINRLYKIVPTFEADIYCMGHQHTKDGKPLDYVKAVWNGPSTKPLLIHATKLLVISGSFLKSYVVGRRDGLVPRGGYAEQGMMGPHQLGGPLVYVRPRWKRVGEQRVWVPDLSVTL